MSYGSCCWSGQLSSPPPPEKGLPRRDGAGWILLFGRVAEILEHHERAAGDLAVEAFGILGRDQPVAAAPEDQRRQLQLRDPLGQDAGAPLSRARKQRPAVARALGQLDRAVDLLLRDLARIAVDVAKALLDQAARQDVLQH